MIRLGQTIQESTDSSLSKLVQTLRSMSWSKILEPPPPQKKKSSRKEDKYELQRFFHHAFIIADA
jgi:hypothetical protein